MDSINGISYYLNKMLDAIKHITDDIFSFMKRAHWCTCIVCATQSNCSALSTSFLLNHAPQKSELNALTTRLRES